MSLITCNSSISSASSRLTKIHFSLVHIWFGWDGAKESENTHEVRTLNPNYDILRRFFAKDKDSTINIK